MRICSWKVDRFTSNQDQKHPRLIVHIFSVKFISPAETRHFCDICLPVYHLPFVDSELKRRKKFICHTMIGAADAQR